MMQRHQNTFIEGLDKDSSVNKYSNSKFFNSENFRIIINEESSTGAIVNVKGTELKVEFKTSKLPPDEFKIIGVDRIAERVIFFIYNVTRSSTLVYVIPISEIEVGGLEIMVGSTVSSYLYYNGDFGFTADSKLRIVSRKENEDLHKIYFTDGETPLRFMNVSEENRLTLLNTPVSRLEIVPDVELNSPDIVGLISGRLKSGRVQYAYQLYNINGAESTFSATSDLVNLTTSNETVSVRTFKGSDVGTDSGKGVEISIDNIDARFDRLRVVRILYEDLNLEPEISIVYEGQFIHGETFNFSDFGTATLGELTIEELNELLVNPIPKTLETKNNFLFIANTEEDSFDFEFDAQVFRYRDDAGSEQTYTGLFNPYNNYFKTAVDLYKYHTALGANTILGGKSDAIEYQFRTKKIKLDSTVNGRLFGEAPASIYSYAKQENSTKYVGYQRDEIYRFGFVGYDAKMRRSFVKWVDDIRFPDFNDGTESYFASAYSGDPVTPAYQTITLLLDNDLDPLPTYEATYEITFTIGGNDVTVIFEHSTDRTWWQSYQMFFSSFNGNEPFNRIFIDSYDDTDVTGHTLDITFRCDTSDFATSWDADLDPASLDILYGVSIGAYSAFALPPGATEAVENDYALTSEDGGDLYAHVLHPAFKINVDELPEEVKAIQIVRVKRDGTNRTVVDMGVASTLLTHVFASYTKRFSGIPIIGDNRTDIDYHSPEHLFNRAYGVVGNHFESLAALTSTVDEFTFNDQMKVVKSKTYSFITDFVKAEISNGGNHLHSQNTDSITTFGADFIKNEAKYDTGLGDPAVIAGTKGSCKLLKTATDIYGSTHSSGILGRRRYSSYPYGGITESSLGTSEYIAVSDIYEVDDPALEGFIPVFNGDTYIGYHEYLRTIWDYEGREPEKRLVVNEIHPVESTINLQIINNDTFNSLYDGVDDFMNTIEIRGMQETVGSWQIAGGDFFNQTFNLYTYNSVYSKQNDAKKFYPAPVDVQLVTTRPYRIYHSDRKIPGEFADRWTKFRPNNFLDVDTRYGEITRLFNFRDTMFYFQPEGFGALFIEPKELVQSSTPGPLIAGTGGVLDRYHYYATNSGLSDYFGLTGSKQSIYYYDRLNRKICRVEENGARFLSDIKSISSLVKAMIPSDEVVFANDNDYSEILMSIDGIKTLVFSELLDTFSGFHSYASKFFLQLSRNLYGVPLDNPSRIHLHNVGDYGVFYDNEIAPSKLTIIVNPLGNNVCVYDVIELTFELSGNDNDNTENLCVDSIRMYNEYQDTGNLLLTPDDNIVQRFRTWRLNTLIDNTEVDEPRLRSASIFMDLQYDNISNYKLTLHDIVTKFRSTVKQ